MVDIFSPSIILAIVSPFFVRSISIKRFLTIDGIDDNKNSDTGTAFTKLIYKYDVCARGLASTENLDFEFTQFNDTPRSVLRTGLILRALEQFISVKACFVFAYFFALHGCSNPSVNPSIAFFGNTGTGSPRLANLL